MAKRLFQKKIVYKKGKKLSIFLKIGLFLIGILFFFILASAGVFIYYIKDLPRPEDFNERIPVQSTKIYDRTGKVLLYEIYKKKKER